MERYEFTDTSDAPQVHISEVNGSLRIKGWDRNEIRVEADSEDAANVKVKGDRFDISCNSGCLIRVPHLSALNIGDVKSDLMLKSLEGDIDIQSVDGQALLKAIGDTEIQKINGNFSARQVEGDLKLHAANGNVSIRDVEGVVELEKSTGNLSFRGIAQSMNAETSGNAILRLEPESGGKRQKSLKVCSVLFLIH